MNNKFLFSIIICAYNSEKYISETLNSIVNQTYSNWEIILINDGSTDKTESIILEYIDKGVNIKYFYQKNHGFAFSRNLAIKKATSDWIVIIDHDDICLPNRLNIHYDQILNDKNNCKLFFGNTIHFDNISNKKKHFDQFDINNINMKKPNVASSLLSIGCFIDSESVVFNKIAAISAGLLNTKYKYVSDYDFFIKMGIIYNFNYTYLNVSKWRIHNKQATVTMKKIIRNEMFDIYVNYLFNKNIFFVCKLNIIIKLIKLLFKRII